MLRALVLAPLALAPFAVGAVVVGSTVGPLAQDPDEEDDDPLGFEEDDSVQRDIFGRLKGRKGRAPFEGAWQLLDFAAEGYPEEGLAALGYLVISGGFMALELRIEYGEEEQDEDGFAPVAAFQTLICEYTLEGANMMQCTTLIGASFDGDEDAIYYDTGEEPREFILEHKGGLLTLEWGEDNVMSFSRRHHTAQVQEDIFGKPRDTGPLGEDIFGRRGVPEDEDDDDDG